MPDIALPENRSKSHPDQPEIDLEIADFERKMAQSEFVIRLGRGLERLYTSDGTLALGFGMDGRADWDEVCKRYRMLIYERGVERSDRCGNTTRAGFSAQEIRDVLDCGGTMPWHALVKCRVRYFTEGVIFGSAEYVQSHENQLRKWFGLENSRLAKRLREWPESPFHVFRRFWARQVIVATCGSARREVVAGGRKTGSGSARFTSTQGGAVDGAARRNLCPNLVEEMTADGCFEHASSSPHHPIAIP